MCARCHCLGHRENICPNPEACTTCGHAKHATVIVPDTGRMQCAGGTLFCQGCKKVGHLATSNSCPTSMETNKKMQEDYQRFRKQHQQQAHLQTSLSERFVKIPVPPSGRVWAEVKNGKKSSASLKPDRATPPHFRSLYLYLRAETEAMAKKLKNN